MNFIEQIFINLLQIIYQDPDGIVFVSMDFKSKNLNWALYMVGINCKVPKFAKR